MAKRERFKAATAVFLFVLRDDEVLLLERGNTGWMDGLYSVPAGAVDGNETLVSAIIREANEEVGIVVQPADLSLIHVLHARTEAEEWTGIFFATRTWAGTPAINEPHKHSALQWAQLGKLPDRMVPYVANALKAYTNGQSYSDYGW